MWKGISGAFTVSFRFFLPLRLSSVNFRPLPLRFVFFLYLYCNDTVCVDSRKWVRSVLGRSHDRYVVYAVEGLTRLPAGWYRILRNVEKLTRPNNKCKYGDFDLSLLSTFGTTRDFPRHVDVTIIRCLILWKRDKQKNYICTLSISMNKKYYDWFVDIEH